jgi:hypothetical protein
LARGSAGRRCPELPQRGHRAAYHDGTGPRLRAAIEALPFESPKLSATAVFPAGEDFTARLERAIFRSGAEPKLVGAAPFPRGEANDEAAN